MNNLLEYKGYYGTVEYSSDDNILFGKVIGISGLLSYEGGSIEELKADFEAAINEYLESCKEQNIEPQKVYRGSFNVRISPSLHKSLSLSAAAHNQTLNSTVENAIRAYVN
ncbi:MAG: type II toxin-antitoxin system HicB family antitoxin [Clostridia bacterium]|nr:type II toxin-antitoxin system HicB family antitoxin [Clostridia bacterium]